MLLGREGSQNVTLVLGLHTWRLSGQHLLCSEGPRAPNRRLRFDPMRVHVHESREKGSGSFDPKLD